MRLYSDRKKCTGCYACANICPKDCIELVLDEEGFRYPVIDETRCIHCDKCGDVCTIDKDIVRDGILNTPIAYACYNRDDGVRMGSATGGIIYTLSADIIESGGTVFGVTGSVIEKVYHIKADNIEDVKKTCKSKYLQSDVGLTYREAKQLLEQGKKVLFTGTPCQIAGLYSFLGKDYSNLYTVDLICHGVPSEAIFRKHIEEVEKRDKRKVVDVYRDKASGWRPLQVTYLFENGTKRTIATATNLYNKGFSNNLYIRKSCYTCRYAMIPRSADISTGDYFCEKKDMEYDKENRGLSLTTINSEKGKLLFDNIKEQLFYKEFNIETVVSESEHLAHSPRNNEYRELFFNLIKRMTYEKAAKLLIPPVPTGMQFRIRRKIISELFKLKAKVIN